MLDSSLDLRQSQKWVINKQTNLQCNIDHWASARLVWSILSHHLKRFSCLYRFLSFFCLLSILLCFSLSLTHSLIKISSSAPHSLSHTYLSTVIEEREEKKPFYSRSRSFLWAKQSNFRPVLRYELHEFAWEAKQITCERGEKSGNYYYLRRSRHCCVCVCVCVCDEWHVQDARFTNFIRHRWLVNDIATNDFDTFRGEMKRNIKKTETNLCHFIRFVLSSKYCGRKCVKFVIIRNNLYHFLCKSISARFVHPIEPPIDETR